MVTKSIRMPDELIEKINDSAKKENRNFTNFVVNAVTHYIEKMNDERYVKNMKEIGEIMNRP